MKAMFDRWDICEAFYVFATNWHGGQWSPEYAIFGRLERLGFKPCLGIQERGAEALTDNGKAIYDALVAGLESGKDKVRAL